MIKRSSRLFFSLSFGYMIIFNLIAHESYKMYPPSFLVAFAFSIAIVMIICTGFAFIKDVKSPKRIEVVKRPVKFTIPTARRVAMPTSC